MKFISWNCQGLGNSRTVRALKKLLSIQQPDLMFIMETKLLEGQYSFFHSLKETYSKHIINCSVLGGGRAGGLAIFWNHCTLNVDIKLSDLNYIDMFISTPSNPHIWRATGLYGYPQNHNKYLTCQLINDLSSTNICSEWLLFGDLNLVLTNEEKLGGNPLDPNLTSSFRNTLAIVIFKTWAIMAASSLGQTNIKGTTLYNAGLIVFWLTMIGFLFSLIMLITIF
jgi:hypothetical protein